MTTANRADVPWARLDAGGAVLELLLRPWALVTCVALAVLLDLPAATPPGVITVAVLACAVAVGLAVHRDLLSLPARLRRVMAQLGLGSRSPLGRVRHLRCRGWERVSRHHHRLTWHLPPGVTLAQVLERQEAIEHATDSEITCWVEHRRLVMEVMGAPIPVELPFTSFYRAPAPPGRLVIGLGRSHRGDLWVDLAALPHLLVGGMTGGGKSVFLRQALTHLLVTQPPDRLRLLCIDLKGGVELDALTRTRHAIQEVVTSVEGAAEALAAVRTEIDRRLSLLRNAGIRDIDAWAEAGRPAWYRVLVVVDELAELTIRELGGSPAALAAQKGATGRLGEIARLGRAVGVHLLLCTQRPDAEAVPGQLKANLAATVAFRVRSEVNSRILLESDRAALLPRHPGRAIWAHERLEEFQAIHLGAGEADRLLAGCAIRCPGGGAQRVSPRLQSTGASLRTPDGDAHPDEDPEVPTPSEMPR